MSDYDRSTRECVAGELRPELAQAIRSYFQDHDLGDVESEAILCCETTSQKKSAGRLQARLRDDLDSTVHTALLLTPQWLIWVRSGDRSGLGLTAAQLTMIQARPYRSLLTGDTGLEVFGYVGDSSHRLRGYIGMGPEPAAQKFCEAVQQAIARVTPPRKGLFGWLGG
jgi:hypothetical protein